MGFPASITVALFDLDGVLTDTAQVHRRAWKETFDAFLARRIGDSYEPFSDDDYLAYVDGRPRADGVREFLKSRDITLPEGNPDDLPGDSTVHGVGNQKNQLLLAVIERDGIRVYPEAVGYVSALRAAGLGIGVVTSSANAEAVLTAADLARLVDVRIDGVEISRRGLRGKPAPDSFVAGAEAFDVKPEQAVVFEDAVAGVEAGRAGAFGYVVGVDRVRDGRHAEALREAGADVVVTDLTELEERR
ncbi:HAD family phosphatase [Nocardia sp. XZ_19_385]|uniref:HAD family hydrolase n=1 Tax=Nocardia sp. XZ_19_385 TaxID=2769488 RepID=UPI00188F00E2|nr:beta-phosphoglucomutase family hydrolase [Nocardia sp. XZ_19_385]